MRFIDALHLVNLCVENYILKSYHREIFVFIDEIDNWELRNKFLVAKELSKDEEAIKMLIKELRDRGVEFNTINGSIK